MQRTFLFLLLALSLCCAAIAQGQVATKSDSRAPTRGDVMLADYFSDQVRQISTRCLANINSAAEWESQRGLYRQQLFEMLGLWPMPPRTELSPVITGKTEQPDFVVERLQFQSMPHLYVTGDLYLPKSLDKPAPAILYVCGHSEVKAGNVSLGNKTAYQHHGEWFARNGYVCLVIDSLQLGEIEGIHHGTYRYGMWWWHSRGYTPAGVEAWNGIRALDYLCSRPEVDASRIGMTGRSGGGAYTWWDAALDERVKVAVPVAGIADLQNHVVDGTVEGHCDCMFIVNTYRWDYPQVAALVAPRPLLICNSDKDSIFPLDGVYRVHEQVRRIYRLLHAEQNLGLIITEGPHKDTQEIRLPVFHWFNRFLKKDENLIDKLAIPLLPPPQLRVFDALPVDQINTKIQETFVPTAPAPQVPQSAQQWAQMRNGWMKALREKSFGGWPESAGSIQPKQAFSGTHGGIRLSAFDYESQPHVVLRAYIAQHDGATPNRLIVHVLDEKTWPTYLAMMRADFGDVLKDEAPSAPVGATQHLMDVLGQDGAAHAWLAPRGIGLSAWTTDPKEQIQIKRRFALVGQTLDGMRVWDVRRGLQTLSSLMPTIPIDLESQEAMAGVALYASLFEPPVQALTLTDLPTSHRQGPDLLNVLKTLDIPAAAAMAAERSEVRLIQSDAAGWNYPRQVARKMEWPAQRFKVDPAKQ